MFSEIVLLLEEVSRIIPESKFNSMLFVEIVLKEDSSK